MAKTKDKISFKKLEANISKGQLANPSQSSVEPPDDRDTPRLPGMPSSRGQTASSIRPMPHAQTAADHLHRLHTSGATDNTPEPYVARLARTPENLPAVISTELMINDPNLPKWHMVKNLPGYMSSAIRAAGRQMFSKFTRTPIDNIQVVSTLSNTAEQLLTVSRWLKENGRFDRGMVARLHDMMPGYEADIRVWHAAGYTFIAVSDMHGHYIYCWPTD